MVINLSEVLSEPHITIEEEILSDKEQVCVGGRTFPVESISPVHLLIEYVGEKKLFITGRADVTVVIPCDRCLADVPTKLELIFEKKVNTDLECVGEDSDSDETNYIDGYHLDVEQLLDNEILIGWPMKVLCSEDCKGICSVCGQNLNEGSCDCEDTGLDPRMSVIRDVFKNFKEV